MYKTNRYHWNQSHMAGCVITPIDPCLSTVSTVSTVQCPPLYNFPQPCVWKQFRDSHCAADFSLLNLPKGKSLGRSKPATSSYAQAPQHTVWVGCPRKWHFGIPRNTEVISGAIPAKFRGIPRNFAEFRRNCAEITSEVKKFRGIPCRRNSVDTLCMGRFLLYPSLAELPSIEIK
jgi:hypothetical protein